MEKFQDDDIKIAESQECQKTAEKSKRKNFCLYNEEETPKKTY